MRCRFTSQRLWKYHVRSFRTLPHLPKGLEGLLIEEAVGLGLEEAREHTSAVRGMATMETAYRLCLWSRLANRVLLVLKRFPMKDAEDLYHGVLDVEWQDHMLADGTLAVEFSGHGSGIDNTHFGALKVKDAIVDKLRTPQGDRPSIDKLNPDLRIHLRLDRGEAICPSTCPVTACTSAVTACSRARHR